MTYLRVLDLFSGIGGFSLGLERTGGFKTVAFCEENRFCQAALQKNWPGVPIFPDIRALTGEVLANNGITPDVLTGGFPCQDISIAGLKAGIDLGERSSLWGEYARLVSQIRPRYAIVENTPGRAGGDVGAWLGRVLGDLAEVGFDGESHVIPAAALGAEHVRDRVFIFAYPHSNGCHGTGLLRRATGGGRSSWSHQTPFADALRQRLAHRLSTGLTGGAAEDEKEKAAASGRYCPRWPTQPPLGLAVHGVPKRLARWRRAAIEAAGNAVCPPVAELLGWAILDMERARAK